MSSFAIETAVSILFYEIEVSIMCARTFISIWIRKPRDDCFFCDYWYRDWTCWWQYMITAVAW